MKKLILSFLVIFTIGYLSSCTKEAVQPAENMATQGTTVSNSSDDTVTQYPDGIDTYVAANYPDAIILSVEIEANGSYEVHLNDGTELYFDSTGGFLAIGDGDSTSNSDDTDGDGSDNIPIDQLPQSVLDYITANYPDATIIEAESENGGYEVELNNGLEIYFDSTGAFLSTEMDDDDDGMDDDDDGMDDDDDGMDDDDDDDGLDDDDDGLDDDDDGMDDDDDGLDDDDDGLDDDDDGLDDDDDGLDDDDDGLDDDDDGLDDDDDGLDDDDGN